MAYKHCRLRIPRRFILLRQQKYTRNKKQFTNRLLPYLYSSPFMMILTAFSLVPFILNIGISFTNYKLTKKNWRFVGLKNYINLLSDRTVMKSIQLTLIFIVGCVGFTMILGMAYAIVMTFRVKTAVLVKSIILLPWIIPESVTANVWRWLFTKNSGIIYYALSKIRIIGPDTSFFFDKKLAMLMVILANVWRTAPFVAIMVYAKLSSVPSSQEESARIDGADDFGVFLHIRLPWAIPVIKRCVLLLFVWSFNSFTIIYVLTNGGPAGGTTTLPYLIRQAGFNNYNFAKAAALSVLSLLIILASWCVMKLVTGLVSRNRRRQRDAEI